MLARWTNLRCRHLYTCRCLASIFGFEGLILCATLPASSCIYQTHYKLPARRLASLKEVPEIPKDPATAPAGRRFGGLGSGDLRRRAVWALVAAGPTHP